jgi:hypothetical protein
MRFFKSVAVIGAVMGSITIASTAHAQNFATFNNLGNTRIVYTNGGSGATSDSLSLATLSGGILTPIDTGLASFRYQVANGAEPFGDGGTSIRALITLTASSSSVVASSVGPGGTTNTQFFNFVDITFRNQSAFVANNGFNIAAGAGNLLTLRVAVGNGATGTLVGDDNTQTPVFNGSQTTGDIIGYSSDFLDFSGNVTNRNFGITIGSAVNTATGTQGITRTGADLNSFYGDFTGNFGATPLPGPLDPTPAPPGVVSGLIGIAMGGAQFGLVRFRKRRRAQKTEDAA